MATFKEYLVEALSSQLYHGTNFKNAYHILKDDEFLLSPVVEGDAEYNINRGKLYFMSFSRNKNSYFINGLLQNSTNPVFIFSIDGNKLQRQFTGAPVQYFSDKHTHNEYEDRLMSNKSVIPNASSYIKSVHCFIPKQYMDDPKHGKVLADIKNTCNNRGIPLYFYTDPDAFKLMNIHKSIALDDRYFDTSKNAQMDEPAKKTNNSGESDYNTMLGILQKDRDDLNRKDQYFLAYLSDPAQRHQIAQNILGFLSEIKFSRRDVIKQYNDIIKNSGSKNLDDLLTKIMKVYGRQTQKIY